MTVIRLMPAAVFKGKPEPDVQQGDEENAATDAEHGTERTCDRSGGHDDKGRARVYDLGEIPAAAEDFS